ncbi:MAG TPA: serine hydrolase domain-containing protein [Vicinamibacterales bacterium]|jgi:CubicO group peptidase (beta-lactamase class C family)
MPADFARRPVRPEVAYGIFGLLLLTLSLGVAGSVSPAKPEEVGLSTERLLRIRDLAQRHLDARNVSGVVTLVARRGRIAHFDALGMQDIETRKPMPKDGIFRLASMSKPITGAAILMLVEEGKIRLNDPVSRFLPEFKTMKVAVAKPGAGPTDRGRGAAGGRGGSGDPEATFDVVSATREITVRDLLTHTSGLLSGGLGAGAANTIAPRGEADSLATYIPKLASVPLDFQPGTLWRYSGLAGFDVLSRIVEIVSGQTFDRFLKQRIFDPLGMKDTGFVLTPEQSARLVTIYQSTPQGLQPANRPASKTYFSGAGGLMSSAEDYLQFAQMLLNGGELNGKRLLGPRTIDLMTANHTGDMVNGQFGRPAQGMGFGLSVQVVQDPVAANLRVSKGAYGWAGGTGVSFWIEPEEQMVSIYLVQGGSGGALRQDFEGAVRYAILE